MRITGLDHIVLNCTDVDRSLAYYTQVLGLEGERVEEWRRGQAPFPSVRVDAGTIIDLFDAPRTGENQNHFCLVMPSAEWEQMLTAGEITVERGPTTVFGARGTGESVYTRDPDGNVVELRRYTD
jgi:catechol 2,3-dioxygenase-like lactoylglutathione lyase family enzyme